MEVRTASLKVSAMCRNPAQVVSHKKHPSTIYNPESYAFCAQLPATCCPTSACSWANDGLRLQLQRSRLAISALLTFFARFVSRQVLHTAWGLSESIQLADLASRMVTGCRTHNEASGTKQHHIFALLSSNSKLYAPLTSTLSTLSRSRLVRRPEGSSNGSS